VARRRLRSRAAGDELLEVYRDNVDAVYAFFTYSVSHEHAELVTAATFERVLRSWSRFNPDLACPRTWIMAIARTILAEHSHRSAPLLGQRPALAASLSSSDDPAAQHLSMDAVREWLEQFKPRERKVLALRFGADLPVADIARTLDLSEANVHEISSRALRRLRRQLSSADLTDNA
jgi:RNA polymerase sigma factor (sigma-70 family)